MTIYDTIIGMFETNDNQFYFKAVRCFDTIELPSFQFFKTIINSVEPKRDNIKITFSDDTEQILKFGSDLASIEFKNFISSSDQIDVLIEIEKSVVADRFSIYDYESFIENFAKLDNLNKMSFISKLLQEVDNYLVFDVFDSRIRGKSWETRSLKFSYYLDEIKVKPFQRNVKLQRVHFVTNFYNIQQFSLLPDDFHILSGQIDSGLRLSFKKFKNIFSALHIANFSSFQNNIFYLSYLPTKLITMEVNFDQLEGLNSDIFNVYDWIFSEENYLDKLSIVRHHLENHDGRLENSDLSVKNMLILYNLYIRNKTEEYLKAKIEFGKFIVETLYRMGDYTNIITASFTNSLFTLGAFILTTIIANIVSATPLDNIFTVDVLWILFCITIGSIIYCMLSNIKFNNDIKNFEEIFDNLKGSYKDILLKSELDMIFDQNIFQRKLDKVKEHRLNINIIWILLTLFLIILITLHLRQYY